MATTPISAAAIIAWSMDRWVAVPPSIWPRAHAPSHQRPTPSPRAETAGADSRNDFSALGARCCAARLVGGPTESGRVARRYRFVAHRPATGHARAVAGQTSIA